MQYEVKLTVGGGEVEVEMDASGKVLEQDEDISVAQMPYGIVSRVKDLVPGGKIKDASKKVKGDKTLYEIDVAARGSELELTFDNSGKLLRIKPEEDDDEHEGKDEDNDKDDN